MTKLLISEETPDGYKLEDILKIVREDILVRCTRLSSDGSPESEHVLTNNLKILPQLTSAIALAEDSTEMLTRRFGRTQAATGEPPE